MFYRTDQPHGLKHNPFNALVIPRPIGWISTVDAEGLPNLAPYSFFNGVSYTPPQVMFAATGPHAQGGLKDTVANVKATGEFVVNFVTWDLGEAMNATSAAAPHGVDEFALAGVTPVPAQTVKAPRVKESPVHLECRLVTIVELPTADPAAPAHIVFGQVVGIHIDDRVIVDGMVSYQQLKPLGRLGYMDYTRVTEILSMERPNWP